MRNTNTRARAAESHIHAHARKLQAHTYTHAHANGVKVVLVSLEFPNRKREVTTMRPGQISGSKQNDPRRYRRSGVYVVGY